MNNLKLGQMVISHKKLYRIGWPNVVWREMTVKPAIRGIYAGYRYLQNGRIESIGYDEGNCFIQTDTFRCALIIENERKNPVRVPFDALIEKES